MNLPIGFVPFEDLAVCSNRLINGVALFAIRDQPVLLIGSGLLPRVWLTVPVASASDNFIQLVESNRSGHPAISIDLDANLGRVTVRLDHAVLLEVIKVGEGMAAIKTLDFRPVGLNIFGNDGGLRLGGMHLSGNHMEGVQTMFALG